MRTTETDETTKSSRTIASPPFEQDTVSCLKFFFFVKAVAIDRQIAIMSVSLVLGDWDLEGVPLEHKV